MSRFGVMKGPLFVSTVLKRIEVAKKLFVVDVQGGTEVLIPRDLSQDYLPISFRYYDALIKISQELMAEDKKGYYKLKNSFELKVY